MKFVDRQLLESLAGSAAFGRGVAYFEQGRVDRLQQNGIVISARVTGSESWRVALTHTDAIFEGSCDCPASDGFEFCKHCVATALAYLELLEGRAKLSEVKGKDRLPAYLASLPKDDLIDIVLAQAQRDTELRTALNIRADIAAGKLDVRAIKKQITASLPLKRDLHRYGQVRDYFARLDTALEQLQQPLASMPPDKALSLIDYTYQRIDRALQTVDDSGGFRYYSLDLLAELHRSTLQRAGFDAEQLAGYLFTLFNQPESDFYPAIPQDYLEELGTDGYARFLLKAQQAWDKLPALSRDAGWEKESHYRHLMRPLLQDAEQREDADTLIVLYAKVANDFMDYLRLSALCLQYQRLDQALWWRKRAEKADAKPYHAQKTLEDNQLAIWMHCQQYEPVLKLLWQRFADSPSVEQYLDIVAVPGQSDDADNRSRAIATLQSGCAIGAEGRARQQRCRDTLARLYLRFKQADCALATAETYSLHPYLLRDVIEANTAHPERILPLVFRLASWHVEQGKNDHYRDAIDVLRIGLELPGAELRHCFVQQLQALLVEYKRKRNFHQWANEAFGDIV